MYKLVKNEITEVINTVRVVNEDGSITSIPFEPANTDYQAYLKWVAEGNTPEAAE